MQWPSRSERVDWKLQLQKLLWGHRSHRNSDRNAGTTQWFDLSRHCTHRSCNIARSRTFRRRTIGYFFDNFQPHHAVTVRKIYREVITWKPSFFKHRKNKTGEQFAEALHSVLSTVAVNKDRSDISLTLFMILPHLTPSRTKNTDDGSKNKTTKRRLLAWHSCNFSEVFCEAKAIQMRMYSRNEKHHSDLKMFKDFMSRGKISNVIRLFSDMHKIGMLAPTDRIDGRPVLEILRDKHPEGQPLPPNFIQSQNSRRFPYNPTVFDKISARLVQKHAMKTHGSAGLSGLDVDV